MERSDLLKKSKAKLMKNEFGQASVVLTDKIALILRHGNDNRNHILPHSINHRANIKALKDIGVAEIVGINSTGSLNKKLRPGMIVVPHDFIALTATPSIYQKSATHIIPSLNENVRQKIIKAALGSKIKVVKERNLLANAGSKAGDKGGN
ncbi:MAG: hypothetical protein MZU91_04065 [Desulfosudis oleivorans]|nr:hypothetical protein [Desulfosudis oleivorans]